MRRRPFCRPVPKDVSCLLCRHPSMEVQPPAPAPLSSLRLPFLAVVRYHLLPSKFSYVECFRVSPCGLMIISLILTVLGVTSFPSRGPNQAGRSEYYSQPGVASRRLPDLLRPIARSSVSKDTRLLRSHGGLQHRRRLAAGF